MQCSEKWLRELLGPAFAERNISSAALVEQLTLLGLEVDSVTPVAADFSGVVVGHVKQVEPHPQADRLRLCEVEVGEGEYLPIVCGAPNVRVGLKIVLVKIGGILPGGVVIQKSTLRGVASYGMICSARELGFISEEADKGILELPDNAPIGMDFRDYYDLDDQVIDIELTPNRGDCASLYGIARDLAAYYQLPLPSTLIMRCSPVQVLINDTIPVTITEQARCPHYVTRIIRNIKPNVKTPVWLSERLRRSGLRVIHPIVDIANYVMLELGQPLHTFDLDQLDDGIHIRCAHPNEKVTVLGGHEIVLSDQDLVIADARQVHALAGIRGAAASAVSVNTRHIVLESAYFDSVGIGLTARRLRLGTDASYRYERGVDALLQVQAAERFTQLLIEICGGEPGPLVEHIHTEHMPTLPTILLRRNQIQRVLGIFIEDSAVVDSLSRLGCRVMPVPPLAWEVTPPSYRYDLRIEVDLLEELIRLQGYDTLASTPLSAPLQIPSISSTNTVHAVSDRLADSLVQQGYHEAIHYSFVNPELQRHFDPEAVFLTLANPLAQNASVMRTSLWPSLVESLQYNLSRQAASVRLFERGVCFTDPSRDCLAGILAGLRFPLQWGADVHQMVDFFDLKGHVEILLSGVGIDAPEWKPSSHPALHPGQAAAIWVGSEHVGCLGALHPQILEYVDLSTETYVFELDLVALQRLAQHPHYKNISKYPAVRRDIAIVIDSSVSAAMIEQCVQCAAGELLRKLTIFDIYEGDRIESGQKSVALNLVLQDFTSTLVEECVNEIIERVLSSLQQTHNATMRV